jgi:hypothetical protein
MTSYVALLNSYLTIFCYAVVDTLSFHRAAQFLVNSATVRQEIGMTVSHTHVMRHNDTLSHHN